MSNHGRGNRKAQQKRKRERSLKKWPERAILKMTTKNNWGQNGRLSELFTTFAHVIRRIIA